MDKKRIRQQAEERMAYGYTRQHVFDELMLDHPLEQPQRVADIVRQVPSLMARQAYRVHHQVLLFAVVASAVMQFARPFMEGPWQAQNPLRMVGLLPIASILLGIGVYKWRGPTFQWLALVNIWGSIGLLGKTQGIIRGDLDAWSATRYLLTIAIAFLGLYLWLRVFPKYKVIKDPLGFAPTRIVFPPEPGMTMM